MNDNRTRRWASFAAAALLGACNPSSTNTAPREPMAPISGTSSPTAGSPASNAGTLGGVAGSMAGRAGPATATAGKTGALAGVTAMSGTAGAHAVAADGVPCDVATIVGQHCATCHGTELKAGAPFALLSVQNFQAPSKSNPARPIYQVAQERVTATDPSHRMPPVSEPTVSPAELKVLGDWLAAGAQASSTSCPITGAPPKTMEPATVGGSGHASVKPIEYNDPELECYTLQAYAAGNRMQKFSVPTTPDVYYNFIMKAPWQGTRYIRSFRSKNDNQAVIHHWIIFKNTSAVAESVAASSGTHPNAQRLYGWSPGADDVYFDPDVGMKAESSVSYTLEAHYNNTTGAAALDASGVEICVTPQVPKYEIQQAWVGTDGISGITATGTCTPKSSETIHVIAAHPHMHKKGSHMKVVLTRKGGMQEIVHDEDFAFDYQRMYLKDFVMNPGDMMTTTCTYSEPAKFGTSTNDEMCYFFPVYWPAGAMVSANTLWSVIHGPNTCID